MCRLLNVNLSKISEKNILLVDDEEDILNILETVLSKEGFQKIHRAETGMDAIEMTKKLQPEIIVLDIMLPDMSGYEVCQKIREFSWAPIIFLSAKADDVDKLLGLGIGGDDYVTKPFSPKEVAFRIKAQLRRQEQMTYRDRKMTQKIQFDAIEINEAKAEVTKSGEIVPLTAKEYKLLLFLVKNANQILSKEVISEKVWGSEYEDNDNALMVHIHHLRNKIEDEPSKPKYIVTQRGLGYKFIYEN